MLSTVDCSIPRDLHKVPTESDKDDQWTKTVTGGR